MTKYTKDKRIKLYRYSYETEQADDLIGEFWCYFRTLSVQETFYSGGQSTWQNAYFTIENPCTIINTAAEIEYQGERWNVLAVDLFEDKPRQDIRIEAKRRL